MTRTGFSGLWSGRRRRSRFVALIRVMWGSGRSLFAVWVVLGVLRVVPPSAFAVLVGVAAGDLARHGVWQPTVLAAVAVAVLTQILPPVHVAVSENLGSLTGAALTDRLIELSTGGVGIGHLEDPALVDDLNILRGFDYGVTGMPMYLSIEFFTSALVVFAAGLVAAVTLLFYNWWLPAVLVGAWLFTHWALRRSAIWKGRNSQEANDARRESQYYFDVAVQPADSKELRLYGLARWVVGRFSVARRRLLDLQFEQTRLAARWLVAACGVVLCANAAAFGWVVLGGIDRRSLAELITVAQLIIAVQAIAFGSLTWLLDDAAAPVAALRRLGEAVGERQHTGRRSRTLRFEQSTRGVTGGIRLQIEDLRFTYPGQSRPVLDGVSLDIHPGEAVAIVGANGAGKTTLVKLLCRLYEPGSGVIRVDGIGLAEVDPTSWRSTMTAVFQDILKLDLTVRENVDPGGEASDAAVQRALAAAGLSTLDSSTVLGKGLEGGTELSGGQWQRIALARSICAVWSGARLVLLDEPTASLDVRGELEVFGDYLSRTAGATRILISHRFTTVRMADRIAVLGDGRVVEVGTHDELIARRGEHARMYELRASRFRLHTP